MRESKGFTIVELVVVIVLLGIAGVVILPRFLEPNAFSEASAQDGLLTTIRAAQQAALGRDAVTFEIDADGGDWVFTGKSASNEIRTFRVPTDDLTLQTGSAAMSGDTCATPSGDFETAVESDFELVFDGVGNLDEFTNDGTTEDANDPAFNGVRICMNDVVDLSVCVSPAGYAYAGNCDD